MLDRCKARAQPMHGPFCLMHPSHPPRWIDPFQGFSPPIPTIPAVTGPSGRTSKKGQPSAAQVGRAHSGVREQPEGSRDRRAITARRQLGARRARSGPLSGRAIPDRASGVHVNKVLPDTKREHGRVGVGHQWPRRRREGSGGLRGRRRARGRHRVSQGGPRMTDGCRF